MKTTVLLSRIIFILFILTWFISGQSQELKKEKPIILKHWMSPEEAKLKHLIGKDATSTDPPPGPVTNFAEYEKMQAVLIRYEFGISYQLIAAMSQECGVTTIVVSQTEQNTVTNQYQNHGVNLANCSFIIAPTNSYWTRDYGPWFVFDGNDEIGIVDFEYNRPRPQDNAIPQKVAEHLGINYFKTDLLHTGGNYMTDGFGVSASTTIVWTENTNYTHDQIAQIMQDYYGIHTYHVVPDPNNTYIDHIDCWGKFLAPDKILIRSVPATHPQYDELEQTAAYFASLTSSYGTPMQVFRVYTPNNQPYTNSLILNKRVFVPIMNSSWDDDAIAVYQEAMPGYEILGFTGSWESTDALHCRTKGIADLQKVYIRHLPLLAEQPVQPSYDIEATVKAFSGEPLYPDSVLAFYRVNGGDWQTVSLTNTSGQEYSGILPTAPQGSQIDYYLYAADQSGQRITQPLIGAADPFTFFVGSQAFPQISVSPEEISATAMQGQSTYENLLICNYGDLELYFTITPNSSVYELVQMTVTDSPSASAYNYNTYTENGWTDLPVINNGTLAGVEINYTWSSDNWPEEGSFMIESPSGTTAVIASGNPTGVYSVEMDVFAGEEVNGNWKLWIEDSFGDGGHSASGISVSFSIEMNVPEWLSVGVSSGVVPPGECMDILIPMSASELEPGMHEGSLLIASNDPNQPEITVPVHFDVTPAQDATVTPDTLWFLTIEDMNIGKLFTIHNPSEYSIWINEITENGSNFAWMIDPPVPAMPYELLPGEDLDLNVVIIIPPWQKQFNLLFDDLQVVTEYGTHNVVVAWDSDLIAINALLEPDTLFFTDPETYWGPQTASFTNTSNLSFFVYEIQLEGFGDFGWWVSNLSEDLPCSINPGESLTFDVQINIPVKTQSVNILFDSVPISYDGGVDYLTVALDVDLVTVNNISRNDFSIYPNPFTSFVNIDFFHSANECLKIEVIDIQGRTIEVLHEGMLSSGRHQIKWNCLDGKGQIIPDGVWFISISGGTSSEIYKVLKISR